VACCKLFPVCPAEGKALDFSCSPRHNVLSYCFRRVDGTQLSWLQPSLDRCKVDLPVTASTRCMQQLTTAHWNKHHQMQSPATLPPQPILHYLSSNLVALPGAAVRQSQRTTSSSSVPASSWAHVRQVEMVLPTVPPWLSLQGLPLGRRSAGTGDTENVVSPSPRHLQPELKRTLKVIMTYA
jgi:hypothetical protein